MAVSVMLSCIVTNREATYVLVFVEDIERFDGRHLIVEVVGETSLSRLLRDIAMYPERSKRLFRKVCCLSVVFKDLTDIHSSRL